LAFLDLLLEAQAKEVTTKGTSVALTDADIREEVDTFLFAVKFNIGF